MSNHLHPPHDCSLAASCHPSLKYTDRQIKVAYLPAAFTEERGVDSRHGKKMRGDPYCPSRYHRPGLPLLASP